MSLIRPFRGLRPASGRAADVLAPPYDVLSSDEARQRARGKPWSFLHISKAEIDLAPDVDVYSAAVYAKASENLQRMLDAGVLRRDDNACYYAYRLTMGEHVQTGLVATASVADYDTNRIRKHEFTRPDKEDDRVRQIEALHAQTGPVLLAYPRSPIADTLIDDIATGPVAADVTADDGIRHQVWVLRDAARVDAITRTFDAMHALYIADGHHRSAAASRVAAAQRQCGGPPSAQYFLTVIFPHHSMRILPYFRVAREIPAAFTDSAALLKRLREAFTVESAPKPVQPMERGVFGMYHAGHWYRLRIRPELVPKDPVASLDVSLLTDHLLNPILGIIDLRRDKRIDFVGGIRGLGELEARVNSGEMALAFSVMATSMDQLIAVADSNAVMPPKSTWFEPKLADGLLSHVLD
jgi:uncharacterized protein (DUF1015 family)